MRSLIYSNLLIAIGAAAITHETYYLLDAAPQFDPLLILVFSGTLLVYNLDRLTDAAEEDRVAATERHRWIRRHRGMLRAGTAIAAAGAATAAVFLPPRILWGLVPLGAAALAYSFPVLRGPSGWYRLKDIAGLKIFVITFVWAGATAFLPALDVFENPFRISVAATVLERAVFIFALTLPFDIRDMERDRASEIRTIPLALGVTWTRRLALGSIALFAALVAMHYGLPSKSATPPLLCSGVLTFALLTRAHSRRTELYYVGLLDGMIAVQWVLVAGWAALLRSPLV